MSKNLYVYLLILALLVVLFRMPSIDVPLDTDSSANAFFARQMIRGETLYDKYHTAHHLPGVYYTFVFAFTLFGDNPIAPKLLLFPFVILSTWLIFLLGRLLFDNFTALLSAIFFVIASSHQYLSGMTAEMELFANLPLIATMFLFIRLFKANAPPIQFISVGILGAISVLYKIIFVAPLITVILSVFIFGWLERKKDKNVRNIISYIGFIAIGFLLPLMFVGGYFASKGLWQRLMLVFTLGFNYFNDNALIGELVFPKPFGFSLFMMGMNNVALLVFGLFGTYRLLRRAVPLRTKENLIDFALVLWMIISFALAGLRGGGFAHYVLVVTPPLAVMCGFEVANAFERWKTASERQAKLGISIIIIIIIGNFFFTNFYLYKSYIPYKLGRISYEDFNLHSTRFPIPDILPIAEYIKSHTTPNDFIYVWSINVQLYYFADRNPPIDILWPSYVSATGSPQRIFDSRTKYIIVDDPAIFSQPQWLLDGLEKYYHLETIIGEKKIYRRNVEQ